MDWLRAFSVVLCYNVLCVLAAPTPQATIGAPAYLAVAGHEQCLDEHYDNPKDTHTSVCLPETKPANCSQESWEALEEMEDNDVLDECNYYTLCLGEHFEEPEHTYKSFCLPDTKPEDCPSASWEALEELEDDDVLEECNPPLIGIGGTTPAYLSVTDHNLCLGEHFEEPEHTHKSVCLPDTKPEDCPSASWEALEELEDDDVVEECNPPPIGIGGTPPAYLAVTDHDLCLGEHYESPVDTHTSVCLPETRPESCPSESWDDLEDMGDEGLLEECSTPVIGIGGTPPAYLSVTDHTLCLEEHLEDPEDTHKSVCLPETKPANCPPESWSKLEELEDGGALEDCD